MSVDWAYWTCMKWSPIAIVRKDRLVLVILAFRYSHCPCIHLLRIHGQILHRKRLECRNTLGHQEAQNSLYNVACATVAAPSLYFMFSKNIQTQYHTAYISPKDTSIPTHTHMVVGAVNYFLDSNTLKLYSKKLWSLGIHHFWSLIIIPPRVNQSMVEFGPRDSATWVIPSESLLNLSRSYYHRE